MFLCVVVVDSCELKYVWNCGVQLFNDGCENVIIWENWILKFCCFSPRNILASASMEVLSGPVYPDTINVSCL